MGYEVISDVPSLTGRLYTDSHFRGKGGRKLMTDFALDVLEHAESFPSVAEGFNACTNAYILGE